MKSKGSKAHGLTKTASYSVWRSMKARCLNPNKWAYQYYGAKGITVCEEWKSFLNFYADMGDKPEGMELDRKDNSKGYCKENCHWTSRAVNNWNRGPVKRPKHQLPRGVVKDKSKFRAVISVKGKKLHLGAYETPEEAHEVYLKARIKAVEEDRRLTAIKEGKKKDGN